jgi:prolyl-tRNA editing enzyme YbaK/EbsC (Cys-tRNA(Pro) deacylase)
MVVTVPGGPSAEERHVLTVIPEGRQADLARVARQPGGTPARLAGGAVAETLTGYRAPACPEVVPGAEPAPAAGIA